MVVVHPFILAIAFLLCSVGTFRFMGKRTSVVAADILSWSKSGERVELRGLAVETRGREENDSVNPVGNCVCRGQEDARVSPHVLILTCFVTVQLCLLCDNALTWTVIICVLFFVCVNKCYFCQCFLWFKPITISSAQTILTVGPAFSLTAVYM